MSPIQFAAADSYFDKSRLPDGVIHWSEARDHIDETVTIYGEVVETSFDWDEYELIAGFDEVEVPATFIEVGTPSPNMESVIIVILGQDRDKFSYAPDVFCKDQAILFMGQPYLQEGIIHVRISEPESILIAFPIKNLYVPADAIDEDDPDFKPVFSDAQDEDDFYSDDDSYSDDSSGYDPNDYINPVAELFEEYYEHYPMAEYEDDPWGYVERVRSGKLYL